MVFAVSATTRNPSSHRDDWLVSARALPFPRHRPNEEIAPLSELRHACSPPGTIEGTRALNATCLRQPGEASRPREAVGSYEGT